VHECQGTFVKRHYAAISDIPPHPSENRREQADQKDQAGGRKASSRISFAIQPLAYVQLKRNQSG
jgi:hypothetical protein